MKILIADIIFQKNLSLRQVSILTGVPKSTLGKLCNGSVPRLDTLEQIAKGLQVRMQNLYDSPWK
ncbi:MAG: helix-turn-helix domain-containing protein [Lachnospiraceae bacterium]|nr:helix-turn-helix domain-containing protein [Lachnospiraceae bacterium]